MPESYRFFRIAVVEDEPTLRDDMADFLSSYGHFVSASPSAEAFWRQHAGNLPDLVILDLGLPGSDGLTLAAQLRELPQPPCILMVTARSANSAWRAMPQVRTCISSSRSTIRSWQP